MQDFGDLPAGRCPRRLRPVLRRVRRPLSCHRAGARNKDVTLVPWGRHRLFEYHQWSSFPSQRNAVSTSLDYFGLCARSAESPQSNARTMFRIGDPVCSSLILVKNASIRFPLQTPRPILSRSDAFGISKWTARSMTWYRDSAAPRRAESRPYAALRVRVPARASRARRYRTAGCRGIRSEPN